VSATARGVAIFAAVLAIIAGGAFTVQHIAQGGGRATTYFGTPLEPPKNATDAVLTDQNGHPSHVLDAAYPATFLFFGYTHCPDECPLALASLAKAYRGLAPAARSRTRIVFVSVDPARDTAGVMKTYVDHFGAPILGLTGSEAELAPVWKAYGVDVDAKSREIGHGDAIYAIDATQRVVLIYTPDTPASELRSDALSLAVQK
jgi:protein SCO1/2